MRSGRIPGGDYDVPDPSDWLSTPLSGLAQLENLLHCQICKDFYDVPMLTSCAHTFCSRCIRTALSAEGKCPGCTKPDQASKLRNNFAVQELVATFVDMRGGVLDVARQVAAASEEEEDKRRRTNGNGSEKKRKRAVREDEESAPRRTTRSKSRRIAASQTSSYAEEMSVVESDEDPSFAPENGADADEKDEDGLVECPLGCGRRMRVEAVEPHLDKCEDEKREAAAAQQRTRTNHARDSRPPSQQQQEQQNTRPEDRINELHYSGMKDAALTKKLRELGIPAWGNKPLMILRHREWVNIWNANCDSTRPRPKRALLNDLDVWERTQGGRAPSAGGLATGPMRKDFDGDAHAKKHHDDFAQLIAEARRKRKENSNDDNSKTAQPTDNPEQHGSEVRRSEEPHTHYAQHDSAIAPPSAQISRSLATEDEERISNSGQQPTPTSSGNTERENGRVHESGSPTRIEEARSSSGGPTRDTISLSSAGQGRPLTSQQAERKPLIFAELAQATSSSVAEPLQQSSTGAGSSGT